MNTLINDLKEYDIYIKENVSFKTLTTYKTGGICKYLMSPKDVNTLIFLLKYLTNNNIKYKIFGNGSNILASDSFYDGAIIKLDQINELNLDGDTIKTGAGNALIPLAIYCSSNNLSGLEWASGIPGTIGGAVYMNAGAYLKSISDVLVEIEVIDDNFNIKTISKDSLDFSYRKSNLMDNKYIVISATLKLEYKVQEEIIKLMQERKERRLLSQPLEYPSAGSVFRNPSNDYAGRLIEECGLKGLMIGGAKISEKHANFVINKDNASSNDIKQLIELAQNKVYEKYNVLLKIEQEFFNW